MKFTAVNELFLNTIRIFLFCLFLSLIGSGILCGIISLSNPGFVDGFPLILTLILAVGFLFLGICIYLLFSFLPWPESVRTLGRRWFLRFTSRKCLLFCLVLTVGIYSTLWITAAIANRNFPTGYAPRLILFGLDGATWKLIDPLMDAGKMPYFKHYRRQGAYGILQSLESGDSPALWTSIATGVSPEKHGVVGFFNTKADLKVPTFWDQCREHGMKVGLYGWMVSWPPETDFVFEIPCWFAHTPETNPPEYTCIQEINLDQDRNGGKVKPLTALWRCACRGARLRGMEQMLWFYFRDAWGLTEAERLAFKMQSEVRMQTDLFLALLNKYQPDVAGFSLYGTDKLGHRFWHAMEPAAFASADVSEPQFAEMIEKYYQAADLAFGRIREYVPAATAVVVVSDHGMKPDTVLPRQFFVEVQNLLSTLSWSDWFQPSMWMRRIILTPIRPIKIPRETLLQVLQDIRFVGRDESVFSVESDSEGNWILQPNFSLTWNPDSPILQYPQIRIGQKIYPTRRFFFLRTFSGAHDPAGIVLFSGEAFERGVDLGSPSLLDIAPTLLYRLHLPICRKMEGRILQEAFPKAFSQTFLPQYVESFSSIKKNNRKTDKDEAFMERLRSTGYVR